MALLSVPLVSLVLPVCHSLSTSVSQRTYGLWSPCSLYHSHAHCDSERQFSARHGGVRFSHCHQKPLHQHHRRMKCTFGPIFVDTKYADVTRTNVHTHACMHARTNVRTHTRTHARTRVRTHTQARTQARMHARARAHAHIHACTHACTHTHTHIK